MSESNDCSSDVVNVVPSFKNIPYFSEPSSIFSNSFGSITIPLISRIPGNFGPISDASSDFAVQVPNVSFSHVVLPVQSKL